MTQRERPASGGVAEATLPSSASPPAPRTTAPAADAVHGSMPGWEEVYLNATPEKRAELLALAERQGVLYARQLPPARNGSTSEDHSTLARLLAGKVDELPPFWAESVVVDDAALDPFQRQAVARALATPDICLIQGLPGTGKTRVIAELLIQAARRGQRVLLTAPSCAAVDRALELIAARTAVYALRLLEGNESPDSLTAPVRAMTLADRARALREDSLTSARAGVAAAEAACKDCRTQETCWGILTELTEERSRLSENLVDLLARRANTAVNVEQLVAAVECEPAVTDVGSFTAAVGEAVRKRSETLAGIQTGLDKAESDRCAQDAERQHLQEQLDGLQPLADARRRKRWWTVAWWRALLKGDVLAQAADLQTRRERLDETLHELHVEKQRLECEAEEARSRYAAERASMIAAEVSRRQSALDEQAGALAQETARCEEKWRAACAPLDPACRPSAPTSAALSAGREAWQQRRRQDEERHTFAQHWVRCLEECVDTLPERVRACANVVAGTLAALSSEEFVPPGQSLFDVLVVDEADQLTEPEFSGLARRARRWVLVGEPAPQMALTPPSSAAAAAPEKARQAARPAPIRPAALRAGCFQRLWQLLHCDPERLPYRWVWERGRLCCQLRPITQNQRAFLETERVADRPDIELRIVAAPRSRPELAEILFPQAMSIAQAKEYVFRELQELPVRAPGHSLHWSDEAGRLLVRLADASLASIVPVCLEQGVRELVGQLPDARATGVAAGDAVPWYTCCIEFDRSAGWHPERARQWLQRYLGLRDLGRTASLPRPQRMQPGVAAVIADILGLDGMIAGERSKLPGERSPGQPVEFVSVPPWSRGKPVKGRGERGKDFAAPAALLPKTGAGLELDLADPRHRDRLPSELRPGLPGCGFVNYLEAQAVVRVLQQLLATSTSRKVDAPAKLTPRPQRNVGVVALYPAQAALIRRLVGQVPALASCSAVHIDVPAGFEQRECDVLVVSLTRSHGHRAVSFGEGPRALTMALTRARERIVICGDPGALSRRRQWNGSVDHLDDAASSHEREILGRLADYLQGHGAHPHLFRLSEGNSA